MLRHALPCILLLLATPLAHAQDPAAIGNGHDPAFVGGRSAPMTPPREQAPSSVAEMERATAAEEIETLLRQVRMQQDGSRDTSEGSPSDVSSALQYRSQAENLVRRNWNQLGPLSRDLYSATFERTHPDEARGTSRYNQTDANDPETRLRAGIRDAEQEMRNLESLLLPMLKDLKQATDTAIEQRARRR